MYSRRNAVFRPRRRRFRVWWVFLTLAILVGVVGVYTTIDNGTVAVRAERVVVHSLPEGLEGFTVLHVSDLGGKRFGPEQKYFANAVKGLRYQAVCITGDMIGPGGDAYPFYELLSALDHTAPIYFISGDNDPSAIGSSQVGHYAALADWVLGAETRGAVFLGAPSVLTVGNYSVWFSDASQLLLDVNDVTSAAGGASAIVTSYYSEILDATRVARARMQTSDLHIALTHKPLSAEMTERMLGITDENGTSFVRAVDLFLAGGTVGGQWRIPFVGPVWSDGWFPGDERVSGLHRAGILPQSQYITVGLGTDASSPLPAFRLFNTPSVTLITFSAEFEL